MEETVTETSGSRNEAVGDHGGDAHGGFGLFDVTVSKSVTDGFRLLPEPSLAFGGQEDSGRSQDKTEGKNAFL